MPVVEQKYPFPEVRCLRSNGKGLEIIKQIPLYQISLRSLQWQQRKVESSIVASERGVGPTTLTQAESVYKSSSTNQRTTSAPTIVLKCKTAKCVRPMNLGRSDVFRILRERAKSYCRYMFTENEYGYK